jgi:L-lactate dehydrogenase (cytochrome)
MNMRLLGARNLKEIVPEMVDASNIHLHTVPVPNDSLYDTNYERLQGARIREIRSKL